MLSRPLRSLVLTAILCGLPCVTHAAPAASSEAKGYYQKGMKAYNLSEFTEALNAFKEAYRVKPDPVFLFNIAQCHRRLSDPEQASAFYHSYLREAPSAPNRPEVERIILEMDAAITAKKAEQEKQRAESERVRLEADRAAAAAAANAPGTTGDNVLVARPAARKQPLVKKGWFWGAVVGGVVVVGGAVALGVVLGRPGNPSPSIGTVEVR